MMTIVTDVRVRPGAEDKWDAVVRDRMATAKERPGWVSAQLLRSESQPNQRVIVGTWRTRADWEAWHRDPRFKETRRQLDELVEGPEHRGWHEVVVDVRSGEDQLLSRRSTTS
jgi:heme-degrading monooxygenase HmoA